MIRDSYIGTDNEILLVIGETLFDIHLPASIQIFKIE